MKKISGLPAFYGKAKGTVVHLRSIDDLDKVTRDSIVVTDKITSEYTEAFIKAQCVISKTGGVTCHAAIVCRECQKPCIVGYEKCFEELSEGETYSIDTHALTYLCI